MSGHSFTNSAVLSFLKRASIYEVNLRQYTAEGTIIAFQQHLPRLKDMGVTIIWLMPIHPIGICNRKGTRGSYYAIADFFEVNPEFGNLNDFKNLVNAIHEMGMKVIIDWVANHAAWDNKWTLSHPDYFLRDEQGAFISPYDWTDVIQINHHNPLAHDAMIAAMCYWVKEFNIDGFRADLAHLTPLSFWVKARIKSEKIKPDLIWLAETENKEYFQAFDIVFTWKWMHGTSNFFKTQHRNVAGLLAILQDQEMSLSKEGLGLFFTSNHDENSWNGTEFEKYGIYCKGLAIWSFFYFHSVPLVYGGQEIPNTKRLLFFDKDELDWSRKIELFSFYQSLMCCRKKIQCSDKIIWDTHQPQLLACRRGEDNHAILFIFNISESDGVFHVIDEHWEGRYRDIFSGEEQVLSGITQLLLKPGEYIFWEDIV